MQYVVDTNGTVPFEEAPQAVRSALAFIKSRASAALNKPVDFNEILSAAYLEEQKMSVRLIHPSYWSGILILSSVP